MITVTLFGAGGRMGSAAVEALLATDDIELKHAVDIPEISGEEIAPGLILEADIIDIPIDGPHPLHADVWVDVSLTEPAFKHAKLAEELAVPVLIGATGFDEDQMAELLAFKNAHIIAPNLSPGVNLLFELLPKVRKVLGPDYDVAVHDVHHKHKKDAPSGTALRMVERLNEKIEAPTTTQQANQSDTLDGPLFNTMPNGPSSNKFDGFNEVQVTSQRVGEVVGEHTITFTSAGEEITLKHRAFSRMALASGIAPAVRFLAARSEGSFTMAEVLGL